MHAPAWFQQWGVEGWSVPPPPSGPSNLSHKKRSENNILTGLVRDKQIYKRGAPTKSFLETVIRQLSSDRTKLSCGPKSGPHSLSFVPNSAHALSFVPNSAHYLSVVPNSAHSLFYSKLSPLSVLWTKLSPHSLLWIKLKPTLFPLDQTLPTPFPCTNLSPLSFR